MSRTTPPKDYYASVMFPGSKKLSIVSKRLGTKERLHAIATVTSEMVADKIVEALNLHQGMLEKLEAPAQQVNDQLREQLAEQRALHSKYHSEAFTLKNEITALKADRDRAIRERDAARAADIARGKAETVYQG